MAPLRVTHVTGGTLTGCTAAVMNLLEHHDRDVVSPSVCFFSIAGADPRVARRVEALGIDWQSVKKRSRYDARSIPRLAGALQRLAPEVVVLHGFGAYSFGAIAARLARVPATVRVEHSPELYSRAILAAARLTGPMCHSTILVSRYLGAYLDDKRVRCPHPEVIYNGVDAGPFLAVARPPLSDPGVPVVLMVARFDPSKDHESLIEGVALLANRGLRVRLQLAGVGDLEADHRRLVERLGLGDRVEFLGYRGDMPALLEAADIAVLSTRYEGFGLVVAEAMAAARPVMATDVASLPELIDESTGILVPARSPAAIADALAALIADPARAAAIGRKGREKVLERFAVDPSVRAYERHFLATAARAAKGKK